MKFKHILILIIFSSFTFAQNSKNSLLKVEYNEYRIYTPKIINVDLGKLVVSNDYSYYSSTIVKKERKGDLKEDETIGVNNIEDKLSEIIINRKENILTERMEENFFLKKKYAIAESLPKMVLFSSISIAFTSVATSSLKMKCVASGLEPVIISSSEE